MNDARPEATMSAETWKAFCLAIVNMRGPEVGKDSPERVEMAFQCDRCQKTWNTAMPLEGVRHMAIQNKCGGVWRLSKGEVQ